MMQMAGADFRHVRASWLAGPHIDLSISLLIHLHRVASLCPRVRSEWNRRPMESSYPIKTITASAVWWQLFATSLWRWLFPGTCFQMCPAILTQLTTPEDADQYA